jgi:hypothetical protein
MSNKMNQFTPLTIEITKSLTKSEKKEFGIFITPLSIIERIHKCILDHLDNDMSSVKKILEPSCGTCEIVKYCDNIYSDVTIDAVEFNDTIYSAVKDISFKNTVKVVHSNFLKFESEKQYDLIIGNPPYFVCKKTDVPKKYDKFIHGRPNIFGLFILHSLSMLKPEGILAFIIPKSFLNSLYYYQIRNYIKETCTIIKIDDYSDLNDFIDTQQSTFGLIIKKNSIEQPVVECKYSMLFNGNFIFTDDAIKLKELFEGSTTLEKMGLKVRTGQIVWNEHKDELTDNVDDTILVYNSNISNDNKFVIKEFKNDEKKQYINEAGRIDPVLVVNRGNGNSAYKLTYALIEKGPFLIENHLNEIYSPKKMEKNKLLDLYAKITNSFKNPKTKKFIELFLGNNGLSKTELETIFPIYDI